MSQLSTNFYLSKWYIDLIDDQQGDLTIVYLGTIQWNFFKIGFANLLRFLKRNQLSSTARFSNIDLPVLQKNSVYVNISSLIKGQWNSNVPVINEILLENQDGYIRWECFMVKANGQICLENQTYQGLGYAERLTLTIKPWLIPIDKLRWGRFLSKDHSIVWICWNGPIEKCLIFHNCLKYVDGTIDDDAIRFSNYKLNLSEKFTIRSGVVGKTVFDKFSWIKQLFPGGFLNFEEHKWQTWSELQQNDELIDHGWSVHEFVDWKPRTNSIGKFFYGILFMLVIPLLCVIWARRTEIYIELPIPELPLISIVMMIIGILLMLFGMFELWSKGHGLPMNAYPPSTFVTTGVYRLFSHPIYIGVSFFSFALSIFVHSSSGFWLVSPILTLAWLALLYGYENEDLQKRFPHSQYSPLFDLPKSSEHHCRWSQRFALYWLIFVPWLILYQSIIFMGLPRYPISTYLSFESAMPVLEISEIFYLLTYPFVLCVPLILRNERELRSYTITCLLNLFIGSYLQFFLPLVAHAKPLVPKTIFGQILIEERKIDGANGAFPSFHVSWTLISSFYYSQRFQTNRSIFHLFSLLISLSCIATGMHSLLDVIAGAALALSCLKRLSIWRYLRIMTEKIANSWSAHRLGPLRIINHSCYAFISSSVGFFLLCSLLSNGYIVFWICFSSLCAAALWGQLIERNSGLSRPFGYFGCILGGFLASIIFSNYFQVPLIRILTCYSLVSPWIQGSGRLRCLVQGCCHGKPTQSQNLGIIVTNTKSRICEVSNLRGIPLHPTPLYSLFTNLIIGIILCRLWYSDVDLSLITGLYFILIGLSRFVEEAFRGEIQTAIYYGLKIYQWISIVFILIGIGITIIRWQGSDTQLTIHLNTIYVVPSILFGLICAFAMGVDFPNSNKKFSRLTI